MSQVNIQLVTLLRKICQFYFPLSSSLYCNQCLVRSDFPKLTTWCRWGTWLSTSGHLWSARLCLQFLSGMYLDVTQADIVNHLFLNLSSMLNRNWSTAKMILKIRFDFGDLHTKIWFDLKLEHQNSRQMALTDLSWMASRNISAVVDQDLIQTQCIQIIFTFVPLKYSKSLPTKMLSHPISESYWS